MTLFKKSCFIKKHGFTLAELLVVVLVISILAFIAMPIYSRTLQRSRTSDAVAVLSEVASKQEAIFAENGEYVTTFDALEPPVKGLTGSGGVQLGIFKYYMDGTCVVAKTQSYKMFKNYKTQELMCYGDGCDVLKGIVGEGLAGCDAALGG